MAQTVRKEQIVAEQQQARRSLCPWSLARSPRNRLNATQEEEEQVSIPYVPLEELLKHGVAAGTPSSARASSCAPPRMMRSS
jgi:hypothetical protein